MHVEGRHITAMIRLLLSLVALSLGPALASAQSIMLMGSKPIADRPVEMVAMLKQGTVPVMAYEKNKPVALINDARKTVSPKEVTIRPKWERAPGFVTVTLKSKFDDLENRLGPPSGRKNSLEAELIADLDLDDAFAVVVAYETLGELILADTDVALFGQEIGRLEAGKPQAVQLQIPRLKRLNPNSPMYAAAAPIRRWALLVFSRGQQIRTSLGSAATDYILEISDQRNFQLLHAERIKGEHSLGMFRSRPFQFSDQVKQRHTGQIYQAKVKVSPHGRAESLEVEGITDQELIDSALDQLKSWIFLPPCRNGSISPSIALIPLNFKTQP